MVLPSLPVQLLYNKTTVSEFCLGVTNSRKLTHPTNYGGCGPWYSLYEALRAQLCTTARLTSWSAQMSGSGKRILRAPQSEPPRAERRRQTAGLSPRSRRRVIYPRLRYTYRISSVGTCSTKWTRTDRGNRRERAAGINEAACISAVGGGG